MKHLVKYRNKLDRIWDTISEDGISTRSLSKKLNLELRKHRIDVKFEKTFGYTCATICAEFDPEPYTGDPSILIRVLYESEHMDVLNVEDVIQDMYYVIAHESRHKYQLKHRSKKIKFRGMSIISSKEFYDYITEPDEVDAYAFETAALVIDTGISITETPMANIYREYSNKKTYNRFLKKVYLFSHK
jgi:hypothetical protein